MVLLQQDRLVSLKTPLGADALLVEAVDGTEAISSLFRFQLMLVSEKRDIALSSLVGQNVTITFELPDKKTRYINGFVSRFSQGDVDQRVAHYYAEVVPWLWFLTRTTDCRIFQKKSVPDIIKQIFGDPRAFEHDAHEDEKRDRQQHLVGHHPENALRQCS